MNGSFDDSDYLDEIASDLWGGNNKNTQNSQLLKIEKESQYFRNKNPITNFNNKNININQNNHRENVIFNFNDNQEINLSSNKKSNFNKVSIDTNNDSKKNLLAKMRNQMNMLNKNTTLPIRNNKSMSVNHINDNFHNDVRNDRNEYEDSISNISKVTNNTHINEKNKLNDKPSVNENKGNKKIKGKGNNGFNKKNEKIDSKSVKSAQLTMKAKDEKITFQLISPYRFTFECSFFPTSEYMKLCKSFGQWDSNRKVWEIGFHKYPEFVENVNKVVNEENKLNKTRTIIVEEIPSFVLKCKLKESLNSEIQEIKTFYNQNGKKYKINIDYRTDFLKQYKLENLEQKILDRLFNFQKEGIKFAIERRGRILLADEMGVGKTIQAICICLVFKDNWPVLVLCPSSLKYNWRNEIMRWTSLTKDDIQVVSKGNESILSSNQKFCIISYDIASNDEKSEELMKLNFQCILVDEAHALKNHETKRCKNLLPIIKNSKRLVVISGTPILARPVEIFTLISSIRPDLYNNFYSFAKRYCGPKETFHGIDFKGTSNLRELNFLLENFMIRRLKKDVLSELPDKFRQRIEVPVDEKLQNMIAALKNKNSEKFQHYYDQVKELILTDQQKNELFPEKKDDEQDTAISLYNKAYLLTGLAKIEGITNYINYLLEEDQKFLVFAHHTEILNKIEESVIAFKKRHKTFNYIRIDGKTASNKRQDLVDTFQEDETYKVAVLSITACATGLTLNQASIVVFAELFFTPAIMIQAEDRAHRYGQKNNVQVKYLVGHKTLDDDIFEALNKKLCIVTETLDDCKKDMEVKKFGKLNYNENNEEESFLGINVRKNPRFSEEIINVKNRKLVKTISKDEIELSYSKISTKEKAKLKGQKKLDEFLKVTNRNSMSNNKNPNSQTNIVESTEDDIINSVIDELDNTSKLSRKDLILSSSYNKNEQSTNDKKTYLLANNLNINSLDNEILELFDEELIYHDSEKY